MNSPRQRYALLLTVVVVGGVLRFGAASYGLPRHDLGQDEMITAMRARHGVLQGRPAWPRFHWPNLNVYMSSGAVTAVRWVEGRVGLDLHDDVLIGRWLSAALGTLTLVALYLAAARLFDPLTGIAAAGFLALTPLHAFRSRLWVPDVPMAFFYTLALLAAVWILAKPTYTRFVAGGVAIGLATATKYNGVGACLPVLVAALLALPQIDDRWRVAAVLNRLALAAAISVAVFFAVDPFAVGFFDEMLKGIGFVSGTYID
ncbi:MAG: ArnT family glycosyltransferase, partial [Thermoanaerobaculia bacterium]